MLASGFAAKALEILKKDSGVDAVVTDLLMPGLDGIELFKASRQIDRFNDEGVSLQPEFILITALRPSANAPQKELNMLQQALDIGFVEVMLKPLDNKVLIQKLAEIEQKMCPAGKAGSPTSGNPVDSADKTQQTPSAAFGATAESEGLATLESLRQMKQEITDRLKGLEQKQQELDDRLTALKNR